MKRLDVLDGFRGVAILLVFLNHVDSGFIVKLFPSFMQPVVGTIFSSGTIGVSLLFILSGLLMAYIYYQPTASLYFWQKRYTRIFPLFITMVLVMAVFRIVPGLSPILRILTIFIFVVTANFLWVQVIQKINKPAFGKIIFIGFMTLQVLTGLWYLFIMKKPPVFFNQLIPKYLHEGTITFVNATLTLPFGNYIPMLDGVYWSLAAEILFYIIYPIICLPLMISLSKQNWLVKILFLFSLLPFFSALNQVSQHIFSLKMLYFQFFMYFAAGIAVGYLLRNRGKIFEKNLVRFRLVTGPVSFFVVIVLANLSLSQTVGQLNVWLRMFWSFPITLLVVFMLNRTTPIFRFFRSRWLIFLGTISYSIYLSHTAIVDTVHLFFRPSNFMSDLMFVLLTFAISILVASALHYLLERPYFLNKIKTDSVKKFSLLPVPGLHLGIILILFVAVFFAYQSNFNFFSYEKSYGKEVVISPEISKDTNRISIIKYPEVDLRIKSSEDNLGIVTADLSYDFQPIKEKALEDPQRLVFQIKPAFSSLWYATNTYIPNEIGDSRLHPFGFPPIEASKNKDFDIRLYLTNRIDSQNIFLNLNRATLTSVHQLNKKDLVKNPLKLLALLVNRVNNVLRNKEARLVFLQLLPFIGLVVVLSKRTVQN